MAKIDGITEFDGPVFGTWTMNPAVYSGTGTMSAITENHTRSIQYGQLMVCTFDFSFTLSGFTNTDVLQIDLPKAASSFGSPGVQPGYGSYTVSTTVGRPLSFSIFSNYSILRINLANYGTDNWSSTAGRWCRGHFMYQTEL